MMLSKQSVLRHLGAALTVSILMASVAVACAQAATYGEVERFGTSGTSLGDLNFPEPAIGVDPEDNSLFVVDQLAEASGFRIQKFSKVEGKYKAVSSVSLTPADPAGRNASPDEVEGVAVDPKLGRVYVLAVEQRREALAHNPEIYAAGALYAYTIEGLKPAVSNPEEPGVLVGPKVFTPQSTKTGVSLLEPSGIAVDPQNDNILVLASEDRGKLESVAEEERTTVLQQITSAGAFGARYVDSRMEENPETKVVEEKSYFEECGCVNSPVVTTQGHIEVQAGEGAIVEIPAALSSAEAPTAVFQLPFEHEHLVQFPGPDASGGGTLAIGAEGRVYARARIANASEENTKEPGVLALGAGFEELGWTGGQSPASAHGECALEQGRASTGPAIAAGKEETVFVLDRESKASRELGEPAIVEFGPNGHGCPTATATAPTADAGGLTGIAQASTGEQVTFVSTLEQANALSVEWSFGDGTSETVGTRQFGASEVKHTYTKSGLLTIAETIHTDDLATPVIKVERQLEVLGAPTVVTDPEAKVSGSSVKLEGSVNPNGKNVTECEFEYGPTSAYGSEAVCATLPGAGEVPKAVAAELSKLPLSSTYHYRLRASSASGTAYGKDQVFTTGAASSPASATTEPATKPGETEATLNAAINPNGTEVSSCQFEYGPSTSYGSSVSCGGPLGKGSASVAVSAAVHGLQPGTEYHFRVKIESSAGAVYGSDKTFTTSAAAGGGGCTVNCGGASTPNSNTGLPAKGEVLPSITLKPVPDATLASTSATVNASGAFTLKLTCPAEESACMGTVTVRTMTAVVATIGVAAKRRVKASILTLATGSFTVVNGQLKAVTLHLTAKARALLARMHTLRVAVTLTAHDASGATHTTLAVATLHATKAMQRR